MPSLDPSVAATRIAVREALRTLPAGRADADSLVLVACSGGADSMALACATSFVAVRAGVRAGLVTIDHGLQAGSAQRGLEVADWGRANGFVPALARRVEIASNGDGPEAAARDARYAALAAVAHEYGAAAVLVGHTRDDQAETVLLGLARGGGPRGLAGMRPVRELHGMVLIRPFLGVSRAQARAACAAQDVAIWDDPHNQQHRFARVRVRDAMSTLVEALGADLVPNLARTAALVAADIEALDAIAAAAKLDVETDGALDCRRLLALPPAVRTRILRLFALEAGAPGGALGSAHIDALDALITNWHGQGPVALPGGWRISRSGGRLVRGA